MTQHLYILTGGSRGMGLAMAHQLLKPGNTLISLARSTSAPLSTAVPQGATLEQWSVDLAQPAQAAQRLRECWPRSLPAGTPAPR